MTAAMLPDAEDALEHAHTYYQRVRSGLGNEMVDEFRRGVDSMLKNPTAWQSLDDVYRRYRLHRFPYGIVYRIDGPTDQLVILAVMHLSQHPDSWRSRE